MVWQGQNFYRYKSSEIGKSAQLKIGNYPNLSLSQARVELQALKSARKSGVYPKAETKKQDLLKSRVLGEESRRFTEVVKSVLDAHFPEMLHDDMQEACGLSLEFNKRPKKRLEF